MKFFVRFFVFVTVLLVSCGKDDYTAGSGQVIKGKNRLIVSVVHHTYSISGITVYLKNNTTEFPGTDTALYDWTAISDNSGIAVFENLFEGNYFLYAKGFDPFIGMDVIGASPAVLNSSTLSNNEVYVTLYVTE